jgi:AhpD family alkylhydroperoxidase
MPNPHLKKIPRAELPPQLQTLWEAAMRDRDEATLIEVAGNAPEVLDWYYNSFYARMFFEGRVDTRIKQLARMKLSTMHGCAFCNRGNSKAALADGVTQEQLDALFCPDSPLFDDRERAVLRLCEEMTLANMDGYMDRGLYDALGGHFDDGEIFELGVCLAVMVGMAKFLFVFDLVSREANCPISPPADTAAD